MFHLLGFLLIIIIAVLVIGLSIVGSVLRAIFGFGRRRQTSGNQGTYTNNGNKQQQQNTASRQKDTATAEEKDVHLKSKKIFSKDEGEYVDFEEIKE